MSPSTSPPSPDVLAELLATHAARHPEKALIGQLRGDGGASVSLPILLGTPHPDKRQPLDEAIAATLGLRPSSDPLGEELARACLLWPQPAAWRELRGRWPSLDTTVAGLCKKKLGLTVGALGECEEPPEAAPQSDRGVWRTLMPTPLRAVQLLLEPPDETAWRMYLTAARKAGADVFVLSRDIALASVRYSSEEIEPVLDRWPGLVVALVAEIAELSGMGAEAQLGNW